MNSLNYLNDIRIDLKKLEKYQAVIYGSILSEYYIPQRSDIDIAIITQNREKKNNINIWRALAGEFNNKYDIKIFELLPIYIQFSIIENYRVVYGDLLEISEYFYHFRKKWDDCKNRILMNQFKNISEKLQLLERRIEFLE